jgi:predicted transcriptional regulator
VTAALDTYAELRLAEGKLLRWGERATKAAACALQPRDLEILVALARYRFLTTGQIGELWWEGRGLRAVRRRMTRLFEAGFVERFRPQTLRGSYQWTYCLRRAARPSSTTAT